MDYIIKYLSFYIFAAPVLQQGWRLHSTTMKSAFNDNGDCIQRQWSLPSTAMPTSCKLNDGLCLAFFNDFRPFHFFSDFLDRFLLSISSYFH